MRILSGATLACLLLVTQIQGEALRPSAYSETKITKYSDISESAKKAVTSPLPVSLQCSCGEVCSRLNAALDSAGLTALPGQATRAVLSVEMRANRYWEVLLRGDINSFDTWMVRPRAGRMGKENFVDAEYVFVVYLPESGDTLFRQTTVMLAESNMEGGIKPPIFPSNEEVTTEMVPKLAGALGRFAPLQTMINSTSLAERRKAVEVLEEIGHPSAVTVLKGRLDIEKDRRLKSRIEKAIEKLQPK